MSTSDLFVVVQKKPTSLFSSRLDVSTQKYDIVVVDDVDGLDDASVDESESCSEGRKDEKQRPELLEAKTEERICVEKKTQTARRGEKKYAD